MIGNQVTRVGPLLALLVLAGCASNPMKIGSQVTLCCPGDYERYDAYALEVVDLPLFMRDYVVEVFDAALQQKGLERNDQINDLQVTLTYRHVNLNPEQQDIDPFFRQENIDVELRFIATLLVEMRETATGEPVWAGQINRIHTVQPGEYMHDDRAQAAFFKAFRNMLASYPAQGGDGQ